jgi:hypothetical protein
MSSISNSVSFGGNWSRNKNDAGMLNIDTNQSTQPFKYMLNPTFAERCNPCRPTDSGFIGKQGVSYDSGKPIIDTESELFNLTRILTRDPNYKFIPQCRYCGNDGYPSGGGSVEGCQKCQPQLYNFPNCGLKYEYTRSSNPVCNLKGTGVNRFQPICLDPQNRERWEHPGETNINYRMISKDNHTPCVPQLIDQSSLLPKGS